jgi:hypothetical protein
MEENNAFLQVEMQQNRQQTTTVRANRRRQVMKAGISQAGDEGRRSTCIPTGAVPLVLTVSSLRSRRRRRICEPGDLIIPRFTNHRSQAIGGPAVFGQEPGRRLQQTRTITRRGRKQSKLFAEAKEKSSNPAKKKKRKIFRCLVPLPLQEGPQSGHLLAMTP